MQLVLSTTQHSYSAFHCDQAVPYCQQCWQQHGTVGSWLHLDISTAHCSYATVATHASSTHQEMMSFTIHWIVCCRDSSSSRSAICLYMTRICPRCALNASLDMGLIVSMSLILTLIFIPPINITVLVIIVFIKILIRAGYNQV